MSKLYIYILFFSLISCSNSAENDQIFDSNTFPQRWELTGMSTGLSGGFLEGDALPWSEEIVLRSNRRFLKTRFVNSEKVEGKGIFKLDEVEGEIYLILNYDNETELIG